MESLELTDKTDDMTHGDATTTVIFTGSDVVIRRYLPIDGGTEVSSVQLPYWQLEELVASRIRKQAIAELEQMPAAQLLRKK